MTKKEEKQVSKFLFGVMNGEINDKILSKDKDELIEVPVPVSTRMKAAELLYKSVAQTDSKEQVLPVIISEDI